MPYSLEQHFTFSEEENELNLKHERFVCCMRIEGMDQSSNCFYLAIGKNFVNVLYNSLRTRDRSVISKVLLLTSDSIRYMLVMLRLILHSWVCWEVNLMILV